ncbi:uncharacterized protein LOC110854689 [Folsomia candida]|uniref:Uncharacterized protein n=1 Tax=Folsomia candida TaxID=158441 RepID=A0A226DV53_FOLCA|nr:uncharacterized protein LOC110854689 [Folsomia candida]OXA49133.1 hypothetical protein Fcan01_15813 [Folsomia candida]
MKKQIHKSNKDPLTLYYPLYAVAMTFGSINLVLGTYEYGKSQLFLILPSVFMLAHTVFIFVAFSIRNFEKSEGLVNYIYRFNNYGALIIGIGSFISLFDLDIYYQAAPTSLISDIFGLFFLSSIYVALGYSINKEAINTWTITSRWTLTEGKYTPSSKPIFSAKA